MTPPPNTLPPVVVHDVGADAVRASGVLFLRPEQSWDNAERAVAAVLPDADPTSIRTLVRDALPRSGAFDPAQLDDDLGGRPVARPSRGRRLQEAWQYETAQGARRLAAAWTWCRRRSGYVIVALASAGVTGFVTQEIALDVAVDLHVNRLDPVMASLASAGYATCQPTREDRHFLACTREGRTPFVGATSASSDNSATLSLYVDEQGGVFVRAFHTEADAVRWQAKVGASYPNSQRVDGTLVVWSADVDEGAAAVEALRR